MQWGGSSTVGLAAIQLAKAAGFFPILTTASPRNHATLLSLGATHTFDYNSPTVVADIQAAVAASGKQLSVVADAVTAGTGFAEPPQLSSPDITKSSPYIAKQALSKDAKDVRLAAVLGVEFDPDWKFTYAIRRPGDQPEFAAWHERMMAVTNWLWANHAELKFKLPRVTVVHGAEAGIKAIQDVFAGKISMEKFVIKHPM